MQKTARTTVVIVALVLILSLGWQSIAFAQEKPVPAAVGNLHAACSAYNAVTLSWQPAEGASQYVVYRANAAAGPYAAIKTLASSVSSFKDTRLTTGKSYYYKIHSLNANGEGTASAVVRGRPVLEKSKSLKAKSTAPGVIKLTWKKVSGDNKYVVCRSRSSSGPFKPFATLKGQHTSYTDKNAYMGNTYYYKVFPYRNSFKGPATGIAKTKSKVTPQVQAFLDAAKAQMGKPYVLGGKGPATFDCSGLIYYALNQSGYRISYMTSYGWCGSAFPSVAKFDQMQAGDILCRPGHVAIYAGDNKTIEAVHAGVSIREYWSFGGTFTGVKRIF